MATDGEPRHGGADPFSLGVATSLMEGKNTTVGSGWPLASRARLVRAGETGTTLLETAVSLLLFSLVVVGLVGAILLGQRQGAIADTRDEGRVTSYAQTEYILAQPFARFYDASPATPSSVGVGVEISTVIADLLQKVAISTTKIERVGTVADQETYKANRFLETGIVPPAGGLEVWRPIDMPGLGRNENFFIVVEVLPSATPTDIEARWQLPEDGQGLISIFEGRPFGDGSGTAQGSGGGSPKVAFGNTRHDDLGVIARDVAPGFYTIHFNAQTQVPPARASVACLCP